MSKINRQDILTRLEKVREKLENELSAFARFIQDA